MTARAYHTLMNMLRAAAMLGVVACGTRARAQDASGPLTPPPEHDVHRVANTQPAEAAPELPPAEIVKAFAAKEEQYAHVRPTYTYKKTIKLTEYDHNGQAAGELYLEVEGQADSSGRVLEHVTAKPEPTLRYLDIQQRDLLTAARLPSYPLAASQLNKYELKYIGQEKVDEIDCYIFEAKPKLLERANALFNGVVWVDKHYLEVVKTYGRWVTDLGTLKAADLPFVNFETYRENVDGKYWFPDYARSDDYLHLKDVGEVPVRLVIKWTNFKAPGAVPPATQGGPGGASPATAPSAAPPPAKPQ
ncbi:MAG TPA: hypothetical protein VMT51_09740 [Dongiaceae bacterium]|nr:hypothetical protein [Dongiaceae bacterium]